MPPTQVTASLLNCACLRLPPLNRLTVSTRCCFRSCAAPTAACWTWLPSRWESWAAWRFPAPEWTPASGRAWPPGAWPTAPPRRPPTGRRAQDPKTTLRRCTAWSSCACSSSRSAGRHGDAATLHLIKHNGKNDNQTFPFIGRRLLNCWATPSSSRYDVLNTKIRVGIHLLFWKNLLLLLCKRITRLTLLSKTMWWLFFDLKWFFSDIFLLCSRWRGTPETPSSVWCTQQCPSPARRTGPCPAHRAPGVPLHHQPPPSLQRRRGTSLTSNPNTDNQRKARPCSTVLF